MHNIKITWCLSQSDIKYSFCLIKRRWYEPCHWNLFSRKTGKVGTSLCFTHIYCTEALLFHIRVFVTHKDGSESPGTVHASGRQQPLCWPAMKLVSHGIYNAYMVELAIEDVCFGNQTKYLSIKPAEMPWAFNSKITNINLECWVAPFELLPMPR